MSMYEIFGEPIDVYTRAQALADGALRDVTDLARDAGFRVPVALTAAAWAEAVAWDDDRPEVQDEDNLCSICYEKPVTYGLLGEHPPCSLTKLSR